MFLIIIQLYNNLAYRTWLCDLNNTFVYAIVDILLGPDEKLH